MKTMQAVAAGVLSFGVVLGLGYMSDVAGANALDDSICVTAPEYAGQFCGDPGDDNGDGFIEEDESGWDCRTMGNHICGPVEQQ